MGTWGSGSFDNDDASDFAIDFESDGLAALTDAFDIGEVEYLEVPQAQRAIAAAEILALTLEGEAMEAEISPELYDAIQRHASDITPRKRGLVRQALTAIDRVTGDQSELRQLWEEGDGEEWSTSVSELRERLIV